MGIAHSRDQYIASLDLKQAFDHVRPYTAISMMKHLAFDRKLTNQTLRLWQSQRRFLQYCGSFLLSRLLASESRVPAVALGLQPYIECASPTHSPSLPFGDACDLHGRPKLCRLRLGTQGRLESLDVSLSGPWPQRKRGTCRQKAKRMMAALDDVIGPFVKDTIEILGCSFSPGHSKPTTKEFRRFEATTVVSRRVDMAPVTADSRLFVACTTATATGWLELLARNF